jgi:hypothetical protein
MSEALTELVAQHISKPQRFVPASICPAAKLLGACLILLCAMVASARAQDKLNKENSISAGGKWTESSSEDRMTGAKRVRFELPADSSGDSDDRAKIILFCTDRKLALADFRPNTRMAPPNRPGFWGQPQMQVTVRVDNAHSQHGWNWVQGRFLAMDKGTARELIGAKLFRVEFLTANGPQIAEFSPAGLDLAWVSQACGLTPKKP